MADNEQDSGQNLGNVAEPTAPISEGGGDQQSSGGAEQMLASFAKKLDEIDARTRSLQGDKDRGVKKVEGELRKVLGEYEALKERLGPDGAVEQLELREQLSAIQAQLSGLGGTPSPQATGTSASGALDTAKAIEELAARGLDANSPDFIKVLKSGLSEEKLNSYIVSKTRPQPQASPAGAIQPPATGGAESPSSEALTAEYQQKMVAAQGDPSLARSLKAEYAKKGVPVDSVVFH